MTSAMVDQTLSLSAAEVGEALLAIDEDQWFERKSARISPRDVAVPIVAMANADGGVVAVGLHDGQVESVAVARRNELRQAALDYTEPPVRVQVEEVAAQDSEGRPATLVLIHVPPSESVHVTQKGECYLRVGDESRRLTAAQQRELNYDRGPASYEATPVGLNVADLDQDRLQGFADRIGAGSVSGALAARDLVDRRDRLTVAAELLFDKRPQREFPNALVRVLKYGSNERGVGRHMTLERDARIEGPIPEQIEQAAAQIDEWLPRWQQLTDSGRFESVSRIPRDAWLEGLVNAIIHRSYSYMGDHIRVELFPDRIEITSPGRFPGIVDPNRRLGIRRYARNPRIARVCTDLGYARELGEGIERMHAQTRAHGLAGPTYFQSSSSVTLTLSARAAIPDGVRQQLTQTALSILRILGEYGDGLPTSQLAELAGTTRVTASRNLSRLSELGLVTRSGASKQDPKAVWTLTPAGER